MRWTRGLLRVWLVVSVVWLVGLVFLFRWINFSLAEKGLSTLVYIAVGVPTIILVLGAAVAWAVAGFLRERDEARVSPTYMSSIWWAYGGLGVGALVLTPRHMASFGDAWDDNLPFADLTGQLVSTTLLGLAIGLVVIARARRRTR